MSRLLFPALLAASHTRTSRGSLTLEEDGEFESELEEDDGALERLGDMKPLNDGDAAERLLERINLHHTALRELDGDAQRRGEQSERMLVEVRDLISRSKAEARMEWQPGGALLDFESRYFVGDRPVLGRHAVQEMMPTGEMVEEKRHGILTDPWPVRPEQQRAQRAYAGFILATDRASRRKLTTHERWRDPLVVASWRALKRALEGLPGRAGAFYREKLSDKVWLRSVIDGQTGTGAELIADPKLADIRMTTDLMRRIPGLVRVRPAPSKSFHPLRVTGRILFKKRRVTGADPSVYPHARFSTAEGTVTVIDQVGMALLDSTWAQDAATILDDPMGFVLDWLQKGRMDSREWAYLHGDTAGSHQDTIATWTLGGLYTAGDLDGTESPLKWWIGWRARAADDSKTLSAGGSFDMADHYGALALLGNLAEGAVVLVGLHGLYTQLLGNSIFTTVDKMGALATQITGELGKIGKNPVIISEGLPDQFDSTSGLYSGSSSSSEFVYLNPDRYDYYDLAAGAGEFEAEYPERGAQYTGIVDRGVLDANCLTTESPVAVLYNL